MTNTMDREVHQQKGSVSQSGGQKSQIKMAPGLVPSGAVRRICSSPHPLLASGGLRNFPVVLSLSFYIIFILCVSISVQFSPFYKDASHIGLKHTPMILFSLVQLQRPDSQMRSPSQGQEDGTSASFGGTIFNP